MKQQYSLIKAALLTAFLLLISGGMNEVMAGITSHPRSVSFCIGVDDPSSVSFACKSDYLFIPKYQWQYYDPKDRLNPWKNFSDATIGITGSTTTKLTITRPKAGWSTTVLTVRCAVLEGRTVLYSKTATLAPKKKPVFTLHPASQTKWIGESATFTSSASATPSPAYQWQYYSKLTWYSASGATSSSYTTSVARSYRNMATNTCGTVYSNPATLSLVGITGQPKSVL